MSRAREVHLAKSDADIERCFSVMVQLRSHLTPDVFVEQVKRQTKDGYMLAFVEEDNAVKAVAGFRIMEMLLHGRFLYVDELVTDSRDRSRGHGALLFTWLVRFAEQNNCKRLDLDSGVQRDGAHRFYFQQGMHISAYHFAIEITHSKALASRYP